MLRESTQKITKICRNELCWVVGVIKQNIIQFCDDHNMMSNMFKKFETKGDSYE